MIVAGLTGSIAMGKTTVANMFAALGAPVFDSDAAVRAFYRSPGAAAVEAACPGVLEAGEINRDKHAAARIAVILGAGGAARAIACALLSRSFEQVVVVNRSAERIEALAAHFPARIAAASWRELPKRLTEADLLVNTTPLGMAGQDALAIDLAPLAGSAVVADIVYVPLATPLVEAARRRGLRAVGGLGMLLHQAAPGFERWFGVRPKVTAELRALVEADILAAQRKTA